MLLLVASGVHLHLHAFPTRRSSDLSFPLSAADLPPSPTKSSNLSEAAEVPACNVPSRSPLPALGIAPDTKLGTASSGLGTLEPWIAALIPASPMPTVLLSVASTPICHLPQQAS